MVSDIKSNLIIIRKELIFMSLFDDNFVSAMEAKAAKEDEEVKDDAKGGEGAADEKKECDCGKEDCPI